MAASAPPPPLPRRTLGSQGLEVSALGLGCMSLCAAYRGPMTEDEGIAVLHAAYKRGITFFDTADVYGKHQNEVLVGKGLKDFPRETLQIATKFALSWEDGKMSVQGSPEYVRKSCEGSLQRLGVDYIDLYYQHRVDTSVPIEITVGEMKKLVEESKVKYLGLSEASAKTIRRAHAVHPITAVQLELSLWSRDVEEEIIPTCRELGIGIVAYSPLGRGFFSGKVFKELETRLVGSPRFTPDNLDHHKTIFTRITALAQKHACSPGQLALAWVSHQGLDVVPIPGTSRLPNLVENIGSLSVKLTDAELEEIAAAVPPSEVKGTRYSGELLTRTYQHADTPELVTI